MSDTLARVLHLELRISSKGEWLIFMTVGFVVCLSCLKQSNVTSSSSACPDFTGERVLSPRSPGEKLLSPGGAVKWHFGLALFPQLWNTFHEKSMVKVGFKKSLAALQLDYLDLYLMHFPMGFKVVLPCTPVLLTCSGTGCILSSLQSPSSSHTWGSGGSSLILLLARICHYSSGVV